MKLIALQNDPAMVMVDDEDYPKLKGLRWFAVRRAGKIFGTYTPIKRGGKFKKLFIHKKILPICDMMGFKDKNPLNCQRENIKRLRWSHYENVAWMGKKTHNMVNFLDRKQFGGERFWAARGFHDGKQFTIGRYSSQEAASKAAMKAKDILRKYGDRSLLAILKPPPKRKSKFKYVSYDKHGGNKCWKARVWHEGKEHSFGRFPTELEAHEKVQSFLRSVGR